MYSCLWIKMTATISLFKLHGYSSIIYCLFYLLSNVISYLYHTDGFLIYIILCTNAEGKRSQSTVLLFEDEANYNKKKTFKLAVVTKTFSSPTVTLVSEQFLISCDMYFIIIKSFHSHSKCLLKYFQLVLLNFTMYLREKQCRSSCYHGSLIYLFSYMLRHVLT